MLMRVARRILVDRAAAEDAVSETMLAALGRPESFAGRSALGTWLVAILRRKCIDHVRGQAREPQCTYHDDMPPGALGRWQRPDGGAEPAMGLDPEEHASQRQFIRHLAHSLGTLPARQGEAFVLRYGHDKDIEEICLELEMSPNHLSVMLHRVRHKLRESLHSFQDFPPQERGSRVPGYRAEAGSA